VHPHAVEGSAGTEGVEGDALNMWIMKPVGSSRGRGISILNDISGVSYGEAMVIQRYVAQPLLLDGFKFDLRRYNPLASPYQPLTITLPSPYHYLTITLPPLRFDLRLYVLVTSFNPLEAYLYTEGFGRFTNEPYSLDAASLQNLYVHLTNASIQKDHPSMAAHAEQAEQAEQAAQAEQAGQTAPPKGLYGGSKSSLAQLRQRLEAAGVDYSHMWARVTELVLRTLLAVHAAIPLLTTYYSPLTTHYSPLTTHHSLLTTHCSLLTTHYSRLTTHDSRLRPHASRITPHYRCTTPSHTSRTPSSSSASTSSSMPSYGRGSSRSAVSRELSSK
jgi:hypothetical protein